MAWTESTSGSQACTVTTEHTLATVTAAGTYLLYLDFNASAAGDRFEIRAYVTPKAAATERQLYGPSEGGVVVDVPESKMFVTLPVSIILNASIKYTIKQTHGTSRTIPWWIDVQ